MSPLRKATARAHPNIALVKYWGKRDEALILPHQSSLSLTLAPLEVTTTVEFGRDKDEFILNGEGTEGTALDRVLHVLDQVRSEQKGLGGARVVSRGNFPPAVGLASSAAAFAALALAARSAAGLVDDVKETSILARKGSGSACRSIQGGFCMWRRGKKEDGSDSFAGQMYDERHWADLRMVVAQASGVEKDVGSRDGMRRTVETSPFYPAWAEDAEAAIPDAVDAIRRRDLATLGALAEKNAWRMHASALAADPPLCYLLPKTLEVILAVQKARRAGLPVWFTLDAGPNPVLLTDAAHEKDAEALVRACGVEKIVPCVPGGDAELLDAHLA